MGMSTNDFIKKDMDLTSQIHEYQDDINNKKIAIAMNKKEIDRLQHERYELQMSYQIIAEDPQRNLQGEVIKKDK